MIPHWLKEHLAYHRSERSAILIVLVALLCLIAVNVYLRYNWQSEWTEVELQYGEQIAEFASAADSLNQASQIERQPCIPRSKERFAFDPNTLDSTGWVALGFSAKQTAAILKYRNAGAVFKKPEDLKKLFVVDETTYAELAPYVVIEHVAAKTQPLEIRDIEVTTTDKRNKMVTVELNKADTLLLKELKGIGSSFAKRIVKYRELLGGYTSKEQVLEVYGMDSARYLPIEASLIVDTTIRTRINVNTADFKTLLRHPYLDRNQVNAIINYRKQHGSFSKVQDLQNIHLLKGEPYRKIAPYFTVQ
ncbi:MAG: hypothetical protein EP314_02130 [Bacteroidetes bacterium]|nr:MAG: hypothetical protein EP314_02130 [Bacteroidota bacterium]